jgi:hypothetical protein
MGKGEAQARRDLMELHGDEVEVDVPVGDLTRTRPEVFF